MSATVQRIFGQERDLVIVALDARLFDDSLRWESSSDGELFPHIYAPLPLSAVVTSYRFADAAHVAESLSAWLTEPTDQ